jgi:hypothetical protein
MGRSPKFGLGLWKFPEKLFWNKMEGNGAKAFQIKEPHGLSFAAACCRATADCLRIFAVGLTPRVTVQLRTARLGGGERRHRAHDEDARSPRRAVEPCRFRWLVAGTDCRVSVQPRHAVIGRGPASPSSSGDCQRNRDVCYTLMNRHRQPAWWKWSSVLVHGTWWPDKRLGAPMLGEFQPCPQQLARRISSAYGFQQLLLGGQARGSS